jgi:hypothetical protein
MMERATAASGRHRLHVLIGVVLLQSPHTTTRDIEQHIFTLPRIFATMECSHLSCFVFRANLYGFHPVCGRLL